MYTKDVINRTSPAIGNDVFNARGLPGGADPYLRPSSAANTYDVFSYRQRYDEIAPAAVGGDVTGTAETGQGSQTVDATALLQFLATGDTGQGSQTLDAAALLQFIGTADTGQGSQTVDAVATLGFSGTAETGQGGQTVDAVVSNALRPTGGVYYDHKRRKTEEKENHYIDLSILLLMNEI